MFAFFSLLICVVALNALIAYMGESFTKVNDNMAEELLRQRAGLLIELIALELPARGLSNVRELEEKKNMWSYCLAPTAKVEIIDNADDTEEAQQGLLNEHTRMMLHQDEKLEKQQQMLDECKNLLKELSKRSTTPDEKALISTTGANDVGRGAEIAEQGSIKSIEELLRNQGTKLGRLEEKLVSARPSSPEVEQGKIKAEIEDMFRSQEIKLEKTLGELSSSSQRRHQQLEKTLGELSSSSQRRHQQLENKIDAALVSIQSGTALILPKIASTPRTGGLNIDDVVPATSPVASDMLGVLPADVTRRLDSIQNDHTGGRVETARASFQKLVDWCVLLDASLQFVLWCTSAEGLIYLLPCVPHSGTVAGCPKPKTQARKQKRRDSGRSLRTVARLFRTRSRSRRDSLGPSRPRCLLLVHFIAWPLGARCCCALKSPPTTVRPCARPSTPMARHCQAGPLWFPVFWRALATRRSGVGVFVFVRALYTPLLTRDDET